MHMMHSDAFTQVTLLQMGASNLVRHAFEAVDAILSREGEPVTPTDVQGSIGVAWPSAFKHGHHLELPRETQFEAGKCRNGCWGASGEAETQSQPLVSQTLRASGIEQPL